MVNAETVVLTAYYCRSFRSPGLSAQAVRQKPLEERVQIYYLVTALCRHPLPLRLQMVILHIRRMQHAGRGASYYIRHQKRNKFFFLRTLRPLAKRKFYSSALRSDHQDMGGGAIAFRRRFAP